jgi:outer membrane protein TolC
MCVAMFTVNTLQWLTSDTDARRRRCMTARVLVTVIAAAGLGACAVGPDFKRPETATPTAYRVPDESPVSADGAAPLASASAAGAYAQRFITGANPADDWWTVFASSDLDAVVREAIARNHTLAAAQATVAQARELVKAEAGNLYPQLSFDGGAGRQKYGTQFLGPLVNNQPTFSYVGAGLAVQYQDD